jgi:hypothetical protein
VSVTDAHRINVRLLAIGVVVSAIEDLRNRDPEIRAEARAWFEAPATGSPLFEFKALCEALELEPDAIVERVLHHRVRVTRDDFLEQPRRGRWRRLGR